MAEFCESLRGHDLLIQLKTGMAGPMTNVDLSGCNLTEFPVELFRLKDSLEILNMGGNQLSSLPVEIIQFRKLRVLFFAGNNFETFPTILGALNSLFMISFKSNKLREVRDECLSPSIGWLILTDNHIKSLPASIGQLSKLRKLMLANNELSCLPDELSLCKELELVRLSNNRITVLPPWLFMLPKLAWLAASGNPCSAPMTGNAMKKCVKFAELNLGEKIGEGASGNVFKLDRVEEDEENLVLKLFKNGRTSDGNPRDEMDINLMISHPHILSCVGYVDDGPNDQPPEGQTSPALGIIFPLLTNCESLAGPPSFETVSRDVYPDTAKFSLKFISNLLLGVASALRYLHSRKISHGDLYGHNLLIDSEGHPTLVDFGAATHFIQQENTDRSSELRSGNCSELPFEAIEVNAFGILMEEVLSRHFECNADKEPQGSVAALKKLAAQCTDANVAVRPNFQIVLVGLMKIICR